LQVRVELPGPDGHGVHDVPHASTSVLARHCVPHLWNPVLQTKSHAPDRHTDEPFAGGVQAVHARPHCVVLESSTQAPAHAW
jgi:hypothetical protein